MKKLLFTMLLAAPVLVYAQDQKASDLKVRKPQQYSCREIKVTADGKTMTLRKDVKIETENLTLKADSAVFNDESQTWIAYGTKEIVFNSKFVAQGDPFNTIRCNNDVIRYNPADKTVYME